jgi:glycerate kinase
MREIDSAFGLPDDATAVIEMALASGLSLLHPGEVGTNSVMRASTYGTGELMRMSLHAGVRKVIVGMGGSATVDGGAGCLRALGVRFLDVHGDEVPHGGGFLDQVVSIDVSGLDPRWRDIDVVIASDVDNPTLGEYGAAAVFAPQKGASQDDVTRLEANLSHFFTLIADQLGVDVRNVRGGGAAGAFSAGLMAFLNGRIQSGIDMAMEILRFDEHLQSASLVITGEGRLDDQSLGGKTPVGVARRAAGFGVKTIAIVGGISGDEAVLHDAGIWAVIPITSAPMPLEEAVRDAPRLIENAALRLGYLLQLRAEWR